MKILLISGHGAGDVGACGNGYKEANLTREVVNILAPKLRQYAQVDVYNQNRNAFYDCQNGTFKIGKYDYVLEVHFNAFNGKAYGSECYVTTRENCITVEQAIMKNMKKFFTLRDNDSIFDGVKRTNFLVINTVKSMGMSGALLETCFIDNKNDMTIYQKNKDSICQAICDGIVESFKLKKDSSSNEVKQENKPNPKPNQTLDYTGVITYQAYTDKWLPEVNKCDNTANGFAGIGNQPISGFRCKPQYGDIIYEAHLKGGNWLGAVNSKDYKKNDLKSISSYAGVYGHAIDGIRIKSTKGYVDYRVKTKEDGWLEWARGFGDKGNEFAGIYGHTIIGIQMK